MTRATLERLMDAEFAKDWRTWSDERARLLLEVGSRLDAFIDARTEALSPHPERAEPVAWRWRQRSKGPDAIWSVGKTPICTGDDGETVRIFEVQPLYALAQPVSDGAGETEKMAHIIRSMINRGTTIDTEAVDRALALATYRQDPDNADRAWATQEAARLASTPAIREASGED